jgi:hypothetical protein
LSALNLRNNASKATLPECLTNAPELPEYLTSAVYDADTYARRVTPYNATEAWKYHFGLAHGNLAVFELLQYYRVDYVPVFIFGGKRAGRFAGVGALMQSLFCSESEADADVKIKMGMLEAGPIAFIESLEEFGVPILH